MKITKKSKVDNYSRTIIKRNTVYITPEQKVLLKDACGGTLPFQKKEEVNQQTSHIQSKQFLA